MKFLACFSLCAFIGFAQAQADNPAAKPAQRLNQDGWKKRHEMLVERTAKGGDVLFVGDSITQGWEGSGKKAWEAAFKDWKPVNIGISGDQTGHVLWRITEGKEIEKINPKVIVMMIGTNNVGGHSAEQIAGGIKAIVEEFKKQKPKAKILLLGVFPRIGKGDRNAAAIKPTEMQPKIKEINDIIAKLDDGKTVHYLDIGKVFLDKDGNLPKSIMPDYLHLSEVGYTKWAEAIKEPVVILLK